MSHKPTIVLVPGAWHLASTWDKTVSLLEARQYKCVAVTLPSTTGDPSISFVDDLEAVRGAILAETTQGLDVVVVVHSYGGFVGASAIKGLTKPSNQKETRPSATDGHVIGLALVASGFVVGGLSFLEALGGKPPPFWRLDLESGFAVLNGQEGEEDGPRQLFYHDLPEDEGRHWVGQLQPQSLKALTEGGEHVAAGWQDVPCWYLSTTRDPTLPPELSKMFVAMARDAGADVTVREIDSSHSPMLSRPEETADFISEAVEAFTRG
jgi:pimeloyl-ACP methyl ester carboxylesterase